MLISDKQTQQTFKYIYGPVYSWRLGMSLGIDPLGQADKQCNMDCVYCQLGKTARPSNERQEFIPVQDIIEEVVQLPADASIDHLTFSGRGEPTLASNLGLMIEQLRRVRSEKIAVISNSLLIDQPDVQDELALADFVLLKLDACCQQSFHDINGDFDGVDFERMVNGIKAFRAKFNGKLALQMMFIEQNMHLATDMADIVRTIDGVDEVQLNTPLRPCGVQPLSSEDMFAVKLSFHSLSVLSVYDAEQRPFIAMDEELTALRHGEYLHNH